MRDIKDTDRNGRIWSVPPRGSSSIGNDSDRNGRPHRPNQLTNANETCRTRTSPTRTSPATTLTDSANSLPPQDLEAEQALLGSVLLDPDALHTVRLLVVSTDFYRPDHRILWAAVLRMSEAEEAVDSVTVKNRLLAEDAFDLIGGLPYLVKLVESVPSSANAAYYARIVRRAGRQRRHIQIADDLASRSYESAGDDPDESYQIAVRALEEEAMTIAEGSTTCTAVDWIRQLDTDQQAGKRGHILSGYVDLDSLAGGWPVGEMTVVGARTSTGKTTFMLLSALAMARAGERVAFLSLEMAGTQLAAKLVAMSVNCEEFHVRSNRFENEDRTDVFARATEDLATMGSYLLLDSSGAGIENIEARCRMLHHKQGVACVFIDYLQCVGGIKGEPYARMSTLSERFKALAQSTGLTLVIASQLNRSAHSRKDGRPLMQDLRDSGVIEEAAGMIVLLHRPGKDDPKVPDCTMEVLVDKHRLGPTGRVEMWCDMTRAQIGRRPEEVPF